MLSWCGGDICIFSIVYVVWLVEVDLEVEFLQVGIREVIDFVIVVYIFVGDVVDGRGLGGYQNVGLGEVWLRIKKDFSVLIVLFFREFLKIEYLRRKMILIIIVYNF